MAHGSCSPDIKSIRKDGLVRAAEVKTSKGLFTRPIQLLHDLEIVSECIKETPRVMAASGATKGGFPTNVHELKGNSEVGLETQSQTGQKVSRYCCKIKPVK